MLDELAREIATFVRSVMARVEYMGLAPATVLAASSNGLLTLACDPPTSLPQLVDVPVRHGLPGVTAVSVAAGTRVRVGFDGGDPRKPFAVLWDAGNAVSVTFNASTRRLARTDDTVDAGHLIVAAGSVVSYLAPGVPVPDPLPPGGSAIALSGTITGSSIIRG